MAIPNLRRRLGDDRPKPRLVVAERPRETTISLSEIISAMSFALDLTEDAMQGHALRCCLMGMRIADEIGLPESERTSLYYALLLKDIGCSSNAARMCSIVGGNDRALKAGAKLEDWTKPHRPTASAVKLLWREAVPGKGVFRKAARVLKIGLTQHRNNREMIQLRCDRGAEIMRKLGMGDVAAEAVRGLDEHWDGAGYPEGRKGVDIPLISRICAVAQHLDVFCSERGAPAAMETLRERSGRWFDPDLVEAAETLYRERTLFLDCSPRDDQEITRRAVLQLDPGDHHELPASRIDLICEAFADVVDAKSPFTFRHSMGVAQVAVDIARCLKLPDARVTLIRRAALLHDIGKLSISNAILDKMGHLTRDEWTAIREHPGLTHEILSRIPAFEEVALIAGQHHEKLDGSGYPLHLEAADLSLESRVITLADVYSAMTEGRPYRIGLEPAAALQLLARDVPTQLDKRCFDALVLSVTGDVAHNFTSVVH
ncbi:HDIG domain-containing protein [Granulicella rosea]|uniref:HDIG domain-containing protein n=1 Tax=Granulicella rosea TaxID=474952 RepID=A0A239L8E6_9BACT|nr:HD-GYP domain-containing protein [Granulicella rosea]SNT25804.1 HDIG domain-containing protein [Granulicella rosea]